ncbi:MAG: InlB B-repeat-containing protein [Clostridia bacterium]|nr:InlB B-repeat-containing protein [Clostridia bacterium]
MKNKIKKSLSLIMAVLMVLSCWVWVAPTEAEAAGTSYHVVVKLNITNSWHNGDNNFKVDVTYKGNNGTGDATTSAQQVAADGQLNITGTTTVFDGTFTGFPSQVHLWYDIGLGRNCTVGSVSIFVNDSEVDHDYMSKSFVIDGNKSGDHYINISEISYPKPVKMEGLGGTTNITIPDITDTETVVSKTFTAKAVDQYDVYWYQAPNYYLSQSSEGTEDMSDKETGFWWEPNSALTSATVKVSSAMQEIYSLKSGFNKDYYLVAQINEADGTATGSQTLHFTYPGYDWYFDANVKEDGKNKGNVSIIMEDKTTDVTQTYPWDSNNDGVPDAIINVPNYLAYNQKSAILPIDAELDGFTFYGFWTTPQPDATGAKGQAFSSEASFAPPIDSDKYFNLDDADKALYTDAGTQWNYRTDSITTGDKKYYAWWLAHDITVKFYDIDGTFLDSYNLKAGDTNGDITWPTPANEDGYVNGAFSYGAWTGNWENIDGTVITPDGYTFTKDLILTPLYEDAVFDKTHRVTFYNSNGNTFAAYTKDYNYRDVAAVPADTAVNAINTFATDYSYTFEGWSADKPSTDKTYHVMLEDADYDLAGNPIYTTEEFVVRGDATYYPVFRRHAKPFEVMFIYADATGTYVEKKVEYKYGQVIEIPEEVPSVYAAFGLEFTLLGWQENGVDIVLGEEVCEGATAYVAVYDNGVVKPYNVNYEYRNEAGEIVTKTAEVYEGYEVESSFIDKLAPADKYDDGTQELYFSGKWKCSDGNTYTTSQLAGYAPASHVTFTAVYEDGVPFRTVTYVDGEKTKSFRRIDGTVLDRWTYEVIDAEGNVTEELYVPSKEKTEFGTYEFAGWFDEEQTDETKTNGNKYVPGETEVKSDVTLYPQFIYSLYNYNFVFKNWDGTVLEEGTFHLGDALGEIKAQAESEAARAADETYTYQFLGWDKKVPDVCEGGEPDSTLTFIAQYKPVYIYYNVEWYNDEAAMNDGVSLPVATSKYVYNDKMHTPSVTLTVPTDAPAGQNYVFAGWYYKDANGEAQPFVRNMQITEDMKFYATYALTEKTYKVTVNDGTNTYTLTVKDGAKIADLVSDPVAGYVDETKHNGFDKWTTDRVGGTEFDIENAEIKADTAIFANFTEGEHEYTLSEVVTLPTYPMPAFTDYDGTEVAATTGEGLKRYWCACNKEKTETTERTGCVIPALTDEVKPGATAYIGTANWSDFAAAEADTNIVYANPNTDFIITTSDKGNVIADYNTTGKGIGVKQIAMLVASADTVYTQADLEMRFSADGKVVYDWPTIQKLLIMNYGGWAKVPAMYKDYNANYTVKLRDENLTDGEKYIAYAEVTDKAGNISYIRTAEFVYDATKPATTVSGSYNAAENTYCEQAVITVTEDTDYTVTVDGVVITEETADHQYKIGEGTHQIVVTDKAGNKTNLFFTVLKSHTLADYNEAATCLDAGFTSQRCLSCGADFNREDVDPLGHDLNTVLTNATCTENGYTITTCNRCDMEPERNEYTATGELIEAAKGHAWNAGVVAKAATCQTEGVKNFTCSVCGATKQETIPAEDGAHSFYKPQIVKPTCTQAGQVTQLCRICNETVIVYQGADENAEKYNADYAPTGHIADVKWIVTTEATCKEIGTDADGKAYYGIETNYCSVCPETIKDENGDDVVRYIYDRPVHTWVVGSYATPEVGVEGYIKYVCGVCGADGETKYIDALTEYSITFIGVTVEEVTDETTGEVSKVDKETETEYKDLPGVTVDGAKIPEQKKLDSADGKVKYVFDGWYTKDAEGNYDKKYTLPMEMPEEDITLYAKFKEKDIFYTVDFEVPAKYTPATDTVAEAYSDYKEFKSLMGAIGDERAPEEVPTFAETDYYTFTFDGWYTKGTNKVKYDGKIAGDGTYQAAFKAEAKEYTVIFMSDGVVFDTETVTAGGTAAPSEGTPAKASDADYHYTFKGWYTSTDGRTEAKLTDITEKTTVYAVYTEEAHDKGESGTVKQKATCTLPEITEYTCADCGHVWTEITEEAKDHTPGDPVYNEETGKNEIHCTVCKELLSEADASYTIKFEDYNGRRLGTVTVKVNNKFAEQAAEAAKLASRASDEQYEYTFAGWIVSEGDEPMASDELPAATANVTYVAAYTAKTRTFSVTYATSTLVTPDGSEAKKTYSGIAYGAKTDKDGNDITAYTFDADVFGIPESDSKVHYVFAGWDTDLSKGVTANVLVRPEYDAIEHDFDANNDGVVNTADAVASEATCTESGGYKYTCADCGYYYITGNISAQGHNYTSKTVKEPTFKEEGLAVKTCQRCGDVVEEVLPVKQYIVVTITVKDSAGKAYHGAKVEITHNESGKIYGPNLTNTEGVATFYVEEAGEYYVRVLEIPGREGGYSGNITVNDKGDITDSTLPTLEGESTQTCSCGCHRSNFWGILFRFFHNIIKFFAGRYICCDCPDSRY